MQTGTPKQFLLLNGLPIILHSIHAFLRFRGDLDLVVAIPEEHFDFWKDLCQQHHFQHPHRLSPGGITRFDTVKIALEGIDDDGLVAIHDAVRPLVSQKTIAEAFRRAATSGNGVPCVTISDSVRMLNQTGSHPLERSSLRAVQTPQVFDKLKLKTAYANAPHDCFTDDAGVLESTGEPIFLTEGNVENLKITHPIDFRLAEILISSGA